MEFRILGPLEIHAGGSHIEPGSPRERTVLAMLLLDIGKVVPMERIIDALWDDAPPRTARTQIHICVSALRQRLEPVSRSPTILTRHPGYVIVPGDWRLDAQVFEERVAAAQAAADNGDQLRATAGLRSALNLWRGAPLADVSSKLVQASAVRLRERRLRITEEWAELELEYGRPESIIGPHSELIFHYPYQERLHEQLMLALHRSGRSAEALEVFRSLRSLLAEDLGIIPGERLRRLEWAILNHDAGVASTNRDAAAVGPSHEPHQLPADVGDFTGRDDLTAEVAAALTAAEAGQRPRRMPIAVIAGAGGTGKTACAVHVAHRIAHRFPDGQLYADLRGSQSAPADPAAILGQFLTALGVPGTSMPPDLDARVSLYRSLVSDRRILILLDDAAGEDQLSALLPGSSTCAVLITARRRITGLPGVTVSDVDAFDTDTAVAFLAKVAGQARVHGEREAARLLVERCDGLPIALRVAGARLAARPYWTIAGFTQRLGSEEGRLDELSHGHLSVRAVLRAPFEQLAPGPMRLALALSLLGSVDFPAWVAAAVLGVPAHRALEQLEALIDAHLVQVAVDGADGKRYRMRGLVRAFLRERCAATVPGAERTEMTARVVSGWLALAEAAHVAQFGGDAAMARRVRPQWSPDPEVINVVSADPIRWMTRESAAVADAVRLAAGSGLSGLTWALALTWGNSHEVRGDREACRELGRLALTAARDAGDEWGEAAALYGLAGLHLADYQHHAAAPLLDAALAIVSRAGDPNAMGLVLGRLAEVQHLDRGAERAIPRFEQALALLRNCGDRAGTAQVLLGMAQACLDIGRHGTAHRYAEEALAIGQATRAWRIEGRALCLLGEVKLGVAEPEAAQIFFDRALTLAQSRADRVGQAGALLGRGTAESRAERGESGANHLLAAVAVAREAGERLTHGRALLALGQLQAGRAEPELASRYLREAQDLFQELAIPQWEALAAEAIDLHFGTGGPPSRPAVPRHQLFESVIPGGLY